MFGFRHPVKGRQYIEPLEPRQLLAADPITQDHPLWAIPYGSAQIDGVLNDSSWADAFTVHRTLPFRTGASATVRFMYDEAGFYASVDVKDQYLWADGNGGGAGSRWELENDDSFLLYFDLDGSRDEYFRADDVAIGVNIANLDRPVNGSGAVARGKYVMGDGQGGAPGILDAAADDLATSLPAGFQYATVVSGTINDNADLDEGWTMEMFIPWSALGTTTPTHGRAMGINFEVIFDDSGGARDLTDRRDLTERFEMPAFVDDFITGVHSGYASTQAGIRGPVNYAEVMFIDTRAGERPAPVAGLTVTDATGYSARLRFDAPAGTTTGLGHVSGYYIRYSETPILDERDWIEATVYENRHVPRLAGLEEDIRLIGLSPGTTYHVAVRAFDAAGALSDLAGSVQFATQTTAQDSSGGLRLVPSPLGRMLVTERGDAFVAVGDHLGLSWAYTRNLYTGNVWDNEGDVFRNFHDEPSFEGPAGPYFAALAARGINTMRVYVELLNTHWQGNPTVPTGPDTPITGTPDGLYWLEWRPGEFNPHMRQFIHNLLELADQHGIYVILSAFDTFHYDEVFEAFGNTGSAVEGPWAQNFGGPLASINEFFQTPGTLDIAKRRMEVVADWVNESMHAHRVMGWEIPSEWDSYEWTLNAEGNVGPGREPEFARRSRWIDALAAHMRAYDPHHMVLNSTIAQDPRGPLHRLNFLSRNFDALTPHFYTNANEEPINNPDADRSIRAAIEQGNITAYWLTHELQRRPIINGEWGMTRVDWPNGRPAYGPGFTQADDESLFRTVLWSGLASGQFGTPLRIVTEELDFNGYILTNGMRALQQTIARFVQHGSLGFDFAHYHPDSLVGRMSSTNSSGDVLHLFGGSDRSRGLVYVLKDANVREGTVQGARLTVRGLMPDTMYDAEVWGTAAGVAGPAVTLTGLFSPDGSLTFNLPSFARDLVVRFSARASHGQTEKIVSTRVGGAIATFALGPDLRPFLLLTSGTTGEVSRQDIALLTNFRGRVHDMTPYVTPDGMLHLAVTDGEHRLWIFSGDHELGTWKVMNKTAEIGAPGLTGDLTTYQPSWGSIHVAGLDARGHAINYWWAPGLPAWEYSDLTALFDGPTMTGGLAGYVAAWDGLNLAGLNEDGEVIVYWWAPGLMDWQTLNMTALFSGPTFEGQLDAYVTPWGGLNIAGQTAGGEVWTYWWSPALRDQKAAAGEPDGWEVANISQAAAAPALDRAVAAAVSADGGINLFGLTSAGNLVMLRFSLVTLVWSSSDATSLALGPEIDFPVSAASAGGRMIVAAREASGPSALGQYTFLLGEETWSFETIGSTVVL
ncbi:MAG: hypothetical protein DYG93_03000 [Leptolyngbya sp. PLA2]|nr:hypothetical protein [Leptolyngbya sp.]MCE7970624.1 hypothetical protein [Leptolyngbya sp. PL-A2]MCQ3939778.1 hypothetical protein [cyanobacterium CYA1]MCZ7633345.1 fibronectin type III domain-containing protein [Phycisphaerales bacterium]MDL1903477.1 hypothetical protein [Synechococcales cyanobacterium CNB]GIK18176.1 MAG: hypothetical protein BroJett004_03400 [Planctomycetota bacterium]